MDNTKNQSILIAFHKLLRAAQADEPVDVLLLDSRDKFASAAIHEYNDAYNDEYRETEYGKFLDKLAEDFEQRRQNGRVGVSKMPTQEQLEAAAETLASLFC